MTCTWTDRKKKDADAALIDASNLIKKYGMQLILEALIYYNNDVNINGARLFKLEIDYLLLLSANLERALKEYRDRYSGF